MNQRLIILTADFLFINDNNQFKHLLNVLLMKDK